MTARFHTVIAGLALATLGIGMPARADAQTARQRYDEGMVAKMARGMGLSRT